MIINLYKAIYWWGVPWGSAWGLPMMRFCLRLLTMYFCLHASKLPLYKITSIILPEICHIIVYHASAFNQSWYTIVIYKHRTLIIPLDTKISLCKFLSWLSNIFQNLIFCDRYFLNLIFYRTQIMNLIFNYLGDNNSCLLS